MLTVKIAVMLARQQACEAKAKNDIKSLQLAPRAERKGKLGDKARDGRNKQRRIYDGSSHMQGLQKKAKKIRGGEALRGNSSAYNQKGYGAEPDNRHISHRELSGRLADPRHDRMHRGHDWIQKI